MSASQKGRTEDDEFLEGSVLDTIIPSDNTLDLPEYFKTISIAGESNESTVRHAWAAQREFLFFDELVTFYIVLRTRLRNRTQLEESISRLTISIEMHVTGALPYSSSDTGAPLQERQLIVRETWPPSDKPVVIFSNAEPGSEYGTRQVAYAIWQRTVVLARPKFQLQSARFNFATTAVLTPPEDALKDSQEDDYLPSGVPSEIDLRRMSRKDLSLAESNPYLTSATALERMLTFPLESFNKIKEGSVTNYHAVEAVGARIVFSKLNDRPTNGTPVAIVHLNVAASTPCTITVESIELESPTAEVHLAPKHPKLTLPWTCKHGDEISFLYEVRPKQLYVLMAGLPETPHIKVCVTAIAHVSRVCQPRIRIEWATNVDPGSVELESVRRSLQAQDYAEVSNNLTTSPSTETKAHSGMAPGSTQSAVQVVNARKPADNSHTFDISITVTGPDIVHVWEAFTWELFIRNRSGRERTFAIMPIVRLETFDYRNHLLDLADTESGALRYAQLADALMKQKRSRSMDKAVGKKPGELVSVSPDLEAGPLSPGACHAAELQFLPLQLGVLHLHAIRILDLMSGAFVDVQDLPDIVALARPQSPKV